MNINLRQIGRNLLGLGCAGELVLFILFGIVLVVVCIPALLAHLLWNVILIQWGGAALHTFNMWQCLALAWVLMFLSGRIRIGNDIQNVDNSVKNEVHQDKLERMKE
jgi:hypothetical protein